MAKKDKVVATSGGNIDTSRKSRYLSRRRERIFG
jgi:hypothetical protein